MSYIFGEKSESNLQQCHINIQRILYEAIKIVDFSVITGTRGKEEQNRAFYLGRSTLQWPDSKHNKSPSLAVDIIPYPSKWSSRKNFYFLAGVIKAVAYKEGLKVRWGGDWDSDNNFSDQKFNDLAHFELVSRDNNY